MQILIAGIIGMLVGWFIASFRKFEVDARKSALPKSDIINCEIERETVITMEFGDGSSHKFTRNTSGQWIDKVHSIDELLEEKE